MQQLSQALAWAVTVSFCVLALAALRDWLRNRSDRSRLWLAASVGQLAAVTVLGRIADALRLQSPLYTLAFLVLFIGSAYVMVEFRHALLPLRRATRQGYRALAGCGVIVPLIGEGATNPTSVAIPIQLLIAVVVVLAWAVCVGGALGRVWLASSRFPAVQRSRARALVGGYCGLVLLVVLAIIGSVFERASQDLSVGIDVAALLLMPLLIAGFAPPRWLRWAWREREEGRVVRAMQGLLVFSRSETDLARGATEWAVRIMGADAGMIINHREVISATSGLSPEQASVIADHVLSRFPDRPVTMDVTLAGSRRHAVVVPLGTRFGRALLVTISGSFTPLFGSEEVMRLAQYGGGVATALDRVNYTSLMSLLAEVATAISGLTSVEEACRLVLEKMSGAGWDIGHAVVPGGLLESLPHLTHVWLIDDDDPDQRSFRRAGKAVTPEQERVMATKTPAAAGDLAVAEHHSLRDAAAAVGMHGWICFPIILADGTPGGLLEFFSHRAWVDIDESLLGPLASVGRIVGRVFDHIASLESVERARAAAEAASAAKTEHLSRMSHELRTPLTAILGFAELLQLSQHSPGDAEALTMIQRSSRHLLDLINDVLDISRAESGRIANDLVPVVLQPLLEDAAAVVGPAARERSKTITVTMEPDVAVVAAPQQLTEVVLNLLTNAIKYSSAGTPILVTALHIAPDTVRITVRDEGPGIAPELTGRLFEPFERIGAERSGIQGTGLGLALCRALVAAMNGSIGVETETDAGSTFWVDLTAAAVPLAAGDSALPPEHLRPPAGPGPDVNSQPCVLLVEDNLSTVMVLRRMMGLRPGIRLLSATHGEAAITLAQEHRPDLVILDVHLPDINGDAVLARLHQDAATATIPVVVLSADATETRRQKLLEAGARAYLTKPIGVTEFLALIDTMITPATASPAAHSGTPQSGA